MNIAIIGCGYVGKAAAKHWKLAGHAVTAVTRFSKRTDELKKDFDRVFPLDTFSLREALEGQECILLCVAPDASSTYADAYLGTAKALIQNLSGSCQTLLYTSSTSVYGNHHGTLVDENTICNADSENALILLETEKILLQACHSLITCCIFRLGEIIGPGRSLSDRLKRINGSSLPGIGSNPVNLSPLADIVSTFDFALIHRLTGIYNLCSDVHCTRKELYKQVCLEERLTEIVWDPSKKSIHSSSKIVSNAKLKAAGYTFLA